MALTYSDSNASIFQNTWFQGRVRTATSSYVNYLLATAVEDPLYADNVALANRVTSNSENTVNQLVFMLSGDAEVQAAGPAIPDDTLQLLVNKNIHTLYPTTPPPQFAMMSGPLAQQRRQ